MTQREKRLLEILKESKARGAASISCGQYPDEIESLIKKGLAEPYSLGYRITAKGMKV